MTKAEVTFLGIEAGGTRATALSLDKSGKVLALEQFGPANLRLMNDSDLLDRLRQISRRFPSPAAVGIGIAGARDENDRNRVRKLLSKVWPATPHWVGHDLEILLAADDAQTAAAKVVVLSGTGACCFGQGPAGTNAKVGGWGHILGDRGSGYDIAITALREAIYEYDRQGHWSSFGQSALASLLLNRPDDLIAWIQSAPKQAVAALAPLVFKAAAARDKTCRAVLERAAASLAEDALICARRLAKPAQPVAFVLAGSVLLRQPTFARQVRKLILEKWPKAAVKELSHSGALGAARLARQSAAPSKGTAKKKTSASDVEFYVPDFIPGQSPTEQRNPRSSKIDKVPLAAAVEIMLSEEAIVVPALLLVKESIVRAVKLASEAVRNGGRIFYVGAGTSGRLGVLDSSECPPTFRADPEMIQGIIAGGQTALWTAVEGAEDDAQAGADAIAHRGIRAKDVVIGIAASGRTPFVWGALHAARRKKASTILICFNPSLSIDPRHKPDVLVAPNLGPEVLTGSTRLKCGTATKLILNTISTLTMVGAGKVLSNLMIDLNPSNVKLRDRAVRIVQELTAADASSALLSLQESNWVVKDAVKKLSEPRRS